MVVAIIATMFALVPLPAHADWAGDHCLFSGDYSTWSWTKAQAKDHTFVALKDGYHWAGGCWIDNDIDSTPNEPEKQALPRGEGADCSGFTFKTWALPNCWGCGGKHKWLGSQFIHGPYAAANYHDGVGGTPFTNVSNANANMMDAFASTDHIGMIWTANTSQGQDTIIEAKCETCGTVRTTRNYRGQTGTYKGVRRNNWG
jgi:hypothetical protein